MWFPLTLAVLGSDPVGVLFSFTSVLQWQYPAFFSIEENMLAQVTQTWSVHKYNAFTNKLKRSEDPFNSGL